MARAVQTLSAESVRCMRKDVHAHEPPELSATAVGISYMQE